MNYKLLDNDIILGQDRQYVLRIKDMTENDKPREKLIANGPGALSSQELLAIVLNYGTKKEDVLSMSNRVLHEYGEKALLTEFNPAKLAEDLEIPIVKACQIIASFELGKRFFSRKNGRPLHIRSAKQAIENLETIKNLKKECLYGLYLNSRYQLIHEEVISIGSVTSSIIHPREVFKPAIEHSAVAVILAHNHPSGDIKPTSEDFLTTTVLRKAAQLLGIDLLDHIIISGNKFLSIIEVQDANKKI